MIRPANGKKHILLVDDDRSVTDILSILFETRGYQVSVANSGKEALQKVNRFTDLILLDIILPDQEGFQLCRKIKENDETSNVSIIILTGKLLTQDIIEGLYLGADDYLTKPFEYEELIARMEAVMRRRNALVRSEPGNMLESDIIFELRRIIDEELIETHFQPIFFLEPLKLFGFESLCRPQTNTVLSRPDILFRSAIQFGVYQELELLVWKKALAYASCHLNGRNIFMNCNPYLVEGTKIGAVKAIFKDNRIPFDNVYLEITERSAIKNFKRFYNDLGMYRDLGFKFAVDDVGGGYASLEAIIETRPEVVKIDRHIVGRLSGDPLRASIVRFIVSFCKEHDILVIAEGIETEKDFLACTELGVEAGQGYYLYKPSPKMEPDERILKSIKKAS